MYAVMQQYRFGPRSSAELNRLNKDTFVALLHQAPGFVAYYWLDSGDGDGVSFCVFEDQASAEAAFELASGFLHEHLATLAGKPDVIRGEVTLYAHCGL